MDTNNQIQNMNNNIPIDNEISTSKIIDDILIKYNLKETEDALAKKFWSDGSNGLTLFWATSKFNKGEKTEKNMSDIFIERLHVDQKIAEQIINDIKKDLLPIFKKEPTKLKEEKSLNDQINKPVIESIEQNSVPEKQKSILKKIKEKSKIISSQKIDDIKLKQSKGQDSYRESIE